MTMRIKWNTVPGESGFAYATVKGERVAHIVRSSGGTWDVFGTAPTLKGGGAHDTAPKAKARVRELLTPKEA